MESNLFNKPVKNKNGVLQFYSPVGEKVRVKYIWNETRDGLVEHEKIDIVKEMNERAKGTSIVEQIARLERGDTSVIDPSRVTADDFSCDLSGMPESAIEIIQEKNDAKAAILQLKAKEEADAKQAEEIRVLQEKLDDLKAKLNNSDVNKSEVKDGE